MYVATRTYLGLQEPLGLWLRQTTVEKGNIIIIIIIIIISISISIIIIIIIIITGTFQTANRNWEGRKQKTRRPQRGRQSNKERENLRKKRKQQ